jgi:Phage tail protein
VLTLTGGFRPAACNADMDEAEERFRDAVEVLDRDFLLWRDDGRLPKQMAVRQSGPCVVDPHRRNRARTFSVVLTAADPYKYAAGQGGLRTITRKLIEPMFGGLAFPARFPANFGGAAGLDPHMNPGRAISRDTKFTITGPTPGPPRLLLRTTGEEFALREALAEGQTAVIDCAAETVTIDGVSRLSARAVGAEFWQVRPRANDVRFLADEFNDGLAVATVTYRPAWR